MSSLANPRYKGQLATTRAAGVLVAPDCERPRADLTLLRCADPNKAFTRIIRAFIEEEPPQAPAGYRYIRTGTVFESYPAQIEYVAVRVNPLAKPLVKEPIVEGPPEGMTLNPRGQIRLSDMTLNMITPEQLRALPNGTVLYSHPLGAREVKKVTVGVDAIDARPDRAGFVGVGFRVEHKTGPVYR